MNASVSTENPAYHVYFRRHQDSTTSTLLEDEFSLVVAIGMERFVNSRQETKVNGDTIIVCCLNVQVDFRANLKSLLFHFRKPGFCLHGLTRMMES